MEQCKIRISRVNQSDSDIPLPQYATDGAAGMDICAAVQPEMTLQPGETVLIPTGFTIEVPRGYEAQIRPRSGLAIKQSIGIMNAPGTIDSDYRGEVKIVLTNFGKNAYTVRRGDRIAQMVIAPYVKITWEESESLSKTDRGSGGFGHTGIGHPKD